MYIVMIEPKAPSRNVYDYARLPRLGLPLLGALLVKLGHKVRIYVETLAPIDWYEVEKADLVGFSTITSTAPTTYKMADRVRKMGIPTVIGGSHVTFLADEALKYCDFIVRGEGQETIQELVTALEHETGFTNIDGLSYLDVEGRPKHNRSRSPCTQEEFAELPMPDLSLIVGHENMKYMPYMASWGCPHGCEFCSVISMFGRHMRYRPVQQVLRDLEEIGNEKPIFFYDDNFVVNKPRTIELLRGMLERGLKLSWSAQMRAATVFQKTRTKELDHTLLKLMELSGCNAVYCGFESCRQSTLDAYNKRQKVEDVETAIQAFHDYGIHVHGMFVFGSDTDDLDTFSETVEFALRNQIDTVQFMISIPLPGTKLRERLLEQDRVLTNDWQYYDGHFCTIKPANMTAYQLQVGTHQAMMDFYNPGLSVMMTLENLPRVLWSGKLWLQQLFPSQRKAVRDVLRENWKLLKGVVRVPAFRFYALSNIEHWFRDPRSLEYFKRLSSMEV